MQRQEQTETPTYPWFQVRTKIETLTVLGYVKNPKNYPLPTGISERYLFTPIKTYCCSASPSIFMHWLDFTVHFSEELEASELDLSEAREFWEQELHYIGEPGYRAWSDVWDNETDAPKHENFAAVSGHNYESDTADSASGPGYYYAFEDAIGNHNV